MWTGLKVLTDQSRALKVLRLCDLWISIWTTATKFDIISKEKWNYHNTNPDSNVGCGRLEPAAWTVRSVNCEKVSGKRNDYAGQGGLPSVLLNFRQTAVHSKYQPVLAPLGKRIENAEQTFRKINFSLDSGEKNVVTEQKDQGWKIAERGFIDEKEHWSGIRLCHWQANFQVSVVWPESTGGAMNGKRNWTSSRKQHSYHMSVTLFEIYIYHNQTEADR